MKPTRRNFILKAIFAPAGLALTTGLLKSRLEAAEKLKESDPLAKTLGYHENPKTIDAAKWPKFKPEQKCSNCQLFQGKAGEKEAACTLFQNKIVPATAWCNGWVQKAG